ncbi:hypothetical protein LMG28688_06820 [Paraburkholderia caffeinitolerans]|uniref:Uncharacterized protein n=1 Tax=Paraburkholderia caffeinitolerans TaxID=1723730 RepID=A0A6J5H0L9_9BURK|nr:hypothetical protein LMG28688_06820 [Paraburkholderia caffeinitolerans]
MILSRAPWRLLLATLVTSSICIGQAHAQVGSPGMKQMQDAQRKAEHKARTSKPTPPSHSSQHKQAGSAVPASSP